MKGLIRILILGALLTNLSSCISNPVNEDLSLEEEGDFLSDSMTTEDESLVAEDFSDEDFGGEEVASGDFSDESFSEDAVPGDSGDQVAASGGASDEFADLDEEFSDFDDEQTVAEGQPSSDSSLEDEFDMADSDFAGDSLEQPQVDTDIAGDMPAAADPFADAENEINGGSIAENTTGGDDPFSDFDQGTPSEDPFAAAESAPQTEDPFAAAEGSQASEDPFAVTDVPSPEIAPSEDLFATSSPPAQGDAFNGGMAQITDLQFQANENGGTVVVKADQPLTYTTRVNPDTRQFIVEVDNAILPDKFKRSLNTRDIRGAIGAIDAYQNPGSSTARFVIQLREGMGEPVVQAEGSSLLVIANPISTGSTQVAQAETPLVSEGDSFPEGKILPQKNLSEFLAGNTEFYGKKISVEMANMDIRDALALITEESGVNMVIAEEVRGNVSLKLRQVPWDQALVVLMKAKKLGYTRQGNVLRIAPIQELQAEEDDATKLALSRRTLEPLKVRMYPVSYAKVDDLEKKIKDFLGDRGKVVGDLRTSSLVVTDIDENLDRVGRLIQSLDTQPPQVLVESKIVEAGEDFTRNLGVSWNSTGYPVSLGGTRRGPLNLYPRASANSGSGGVPGNFNLGLSVGTLDFFGTLSAALSISESESQVKVISSPRIMTLSNEKAEIKQVTEVPVRQVTVNGNTSQETFTFKPLQLKLDVTPQVTNDGSVIMSVSVMREFQGADMSSAGAGAFAVNSREAQTKVLVKNGQTAVIGGVYQSDAVESNSGVPWLRHLPGIGWMFSTQNKRKTKSELLVFLTPRIMGQVSSPIQE